MQTVLQELKENLEQQVKIVEKQTEHKFGALWGLNMVILNIDLLLQKEQEQIKTAFNEGANSVTSSSKVAESGIEYYNETFKNK